MYHPFFNLDNTGAVVVRYIYDAWGNHAIVDANGDDVTEGLGVLNPFRYRSYYYDTETGLYYLQTRYYDPELGRFISQDSLEYADPETINGLNLYAYCGDNPVMRADYSGTSWKSFWNAVGRFIGGVVLTAIGANIALSSFFPAIVNPFATVVCEFGLTIGMYGAALMGSVFNSGIYADMELIGWNPYNNNADMVHKSNTMSFYKGVPVIRYGDFNNGDRSGTFGIMLLARNEEPGAVEHEFGHIPQLMILGILRFGLTVGIPSKNKWGLGTYWNDYYLSPWESMAEIFGGVQNSPSPLTDAERARAIKYLIASYFLGPLVYTFYYKL